MKRWKVAKVRKVKRWFVKSAKGSMRPDNESYTNRADAVKACDKWNKVA